MENGQVTAADVAVRCEVQRESVVGRLRWKLRLWSLPD